MEKKIKINKQQLIASLSVAAYMLKNAGQTEISDLLETFNEQIGPNMKENWDTNVVLTDYEKALFKENK